MSIRFPPLRCIECFGPLEYGIAAAPVGDSNLNGAKAHQDKADKDKPVGEVLRQSDGRHLLVSNDAHEAPDEEGSIGKEGDSDDIDYSRQHAAEAGRKVAVEKVDLDMAAHADAHGRTDEDQGYVEVGCNLLRPGEGVIQHVAREELNEDCERHRPEQGQG